MILIYKIQLVYAVSSVRNDLNGWLGKLWEKRFPAGCLFVIGRAMCLSFSLDMLLDSVGAWGRRFVNMAGTEGCRRVSLN